MKVKIGTLSISVDTEYLRATRRDVWVKRMVGIYSGRGVPAPTLTEKFTEVYFTVKPPKRAVAKQESTKS